MCFQGCSRTPLYVHYITRLKRSRWKMQLNRFTVSPLSAFRQSGIIIRSERVFYFNWVLVLSYIKAFIINSVVLFNHQPASFFRVNFWLYRYIIYLKYRFKIRFLDFASYWKLSSISREKFKCIIWGVVSFKCSQFQFGIKNNPGSALSYAIFIIKNGVYSPVWGSYAVKWRVKKYIFEFEYWYIFSGQSEYMGFVARHTKPATCAIPYTFLPGLLEDEGSQSVLQADMLAHNDLTHHHIGYKEKSCIKAEEVEKWFRFVWHFCLPGITPRKQDDDILWIVRGLTCETLMF